jgi:hypothetical protein
METHAHHLHKAPGKKFSHYFFEFFMLFIAVFCGFLVENYREEKVEEHRALELAKSFYVELKNDSITAQLKVQNRLRQQEAIKYLVNYFRDSSLTDVSKEFAINFEYGISFRSPSQFEPRTIMLDQLRNSGSLRYFKNESLQALTGDITVAIKNIYDRQDLETKYRLEYINPIIIQHYDYAFDDELKKGDKNIFNTLKAYETSSDTIPFHLYEPDKLDRNQVIRIISFYNGNLSNSTRIVHIQKYIEINAQLLKVLREEYHLE